MLELLEPHAAIDLLRESQVGRLGLVSAGRPYVVPITYAFDAHSIIGHSGPGQKLDALRSSETVCFEVEQIDDLHHWRSVIAWGRYEELHGEARTRALELLVAAISPQLDAGATEADPRVAGGERHGHGADPESAKIAVYRIHLDEIHGRYETPGSRNYKLRVGDTVFQLKGSREPAA